jgi:RAB protein geranylgeranyltransferase component A
VSSLSHPSPLQASRAYSLDLSPHLLYCSSELVRCLANSKLSQYLEFKALEHIYIYQRDGDGELNLHKVPSSREHIFTSSLSLQKKRKLMKFLNYALSEESGKSPPGRLD